MILCYAMEPEIYLFDEPTANLDIQSIFDLRDILRELKNKVLETLSGRITEEEMSSMNSK